MKISNEAKIGIMVTAVLVLLGIITVRSSDFTVQKKGYTIKTVFYNIDGVDKSAPVRFNGMEVGQVKDIQISYGEETKMELLLWIDESARLRQGAKAHVKNMGLLGEKYIGLSSGDKNAPYLEAGATIVGEEPADLGALIADGHVIAEDLKAISRNINERLQVNKEKIDNIVTNLDTTLVHTASITQNADERLTVNKTKIDETITHFHKMSDNFEDLSYDLKLNPWKLLYREKTRNLEVKN